MRYTFEEFFFKLGLGNFYLNRLVHLLCMTASVICVILDSRREQGVNESGFAQSRFARNLERISWGTSAITHGLDMWYHNRKRRSSLGNNFVSVTMHLALCAWVRLGA